MNINANIIDNMTYKIVKLLELKIIFNLFMKTLNLLKLARQSSRILLRP